MSESTFRLRTLLSIGAAVLISVLAAREAVAASRSLRTFDCSIPNKCTLGQDNCDHCCGGLGLCVDDRPDVEGCLCVTP